MRVPKNLGTRRMVLAAFAICVTGLLAALYLQYELQRPIPALTDVGHKKEVYWPIYHTFTPTQKAHVLDGSFKIVTLVSLLPDVLKSAFCKLAGLNKFDMANPGEKYQETDVVTEPNLSFQRLLFAGISDDKYFLHYEEGGIGHSYHVAVFTIDSEKHVNFLWGGPGERAKDFAQLRRMVAAGIFRDDQAYGW